MSETTRMRVQCGGSVDIDGAPAGRLDDPAYEDLAALVPDGLGFEFGDSVTLEVRVVQFRNTPVS